MEDGLLILSLTDIANVGLLRLLLQRADRVVRQALDVDLADTAEPWFDAYSDERLAG